MIIKIIINLLRVRAPYTSPTSFSRLAGGEGREGVMVFTVIYRLEKPTSKGRSNIGGLAHVH